MIDRKIVLHSSQNRKVVVFGMPKVKSMKYQVSQTLYEMKRFGESKHDAKKEGRADEGIYSKVTMNNYIAKATHFANWCKAEYGCKTLEDCKPYAQAYIDSRSHLKAYTLKSDVSAIRKLYKGEIDVKSDKSRNRGEIQRCRAYTERSRQADKSNPEIKAFCQATGLRRHELEALRKTDIKIKGDKVYIQVLQGKGGKFRSVEVTKSGKDLVRQYASDSSDRIFEKIETNLPIHMYRGDYAKILYEQLMAEKTTPTTNWYHCRGDKVGIKYDRDVMLEVSRNLGHNRVDVIAGHYL